MSPLRSQTPDIQGGIQELLETPRMAAPKPATLATDRLARKKLEAAADFIKHQQWPEAVRLLQQVLDSAEDTFIEQPAKARDGRKMRRLLGARAEAERMLGTLPRQGIEFYHLRYAAVAGERLAAAKRTRDAEGLAETARRYFHTPAGGEALGRLGLHHLDRGRPTVAARCFQRLLQRADSDQLPAITLFHAAVAFHGAGDSDNADRAWQRLAARAGNEGMRLGERLVPLEQLRKYVDGAPRERDPSDWLLFRGQPSRTGDAAGEWPYLEPRWRIDTAQRDESQRWLAHAQHLQAKNGLPILPGSVPLVTGGRIVFRSHDGVRAVDLRSGQEFWRSPMPLALDGLMENPGRKVQFNNWIWSYTGHFHLVYENAVLGSLSADQQRVYAVEDLPVPPHPQIMLQVHEESYPLGPLQSAAFHNRLRAIDLETGRLLWERGGAGNEHDPLCNGFFLGAPLPLAGKLYGLFEKRGDVQLICLDADSGALAWSQTLASAADQTTLNLCRRMRAAPLAYADGVLICPTNAGAVVGIDLVSRSLLWAKTYDLRVGVPSEDNPTYDPGLQLASWRYCAPLIRDGKVVLASPDGDALLCLNLRDGELLWQTHRAEDDLYVACIQRDKVILIGRRCCRALHLKDGTPAWQVMMGLPSGLGALSGGVYYLPLQRGAICAIDIEAGRDLGCTASPRSEAPGNLVFAQGSLISQSAATLAVYPTLQERLAFLDGAPNRGAALLQRGRLRLQQDDLPGAARDFRAVLSSQPTASLATKARDGLYETLTRLLLHDPAAVAQHLEEYRALCRLSIPENATPRQRARLERDEQGRQVNLLRLIAMIDEQQGRLVEALRAYQQLYARDAGSELTSGLEDAALRSRLDVWAAGRVCDLLARAKPAARAALDAEIEAAWRNAQAAPNRDSLARFVALFGDHGTRGQEARLLLAERLIEEDGPGRVLEAEQHLLHLLRPGTDRRMTGRALEGLVRLMLRKGLPEDALYYYRLLHRDEAELQADKRFLTLLQNAPPAWAGHRLRYVEPTQENPPQPPPEAFGMPVGLEPEQDPSRIGTPFDVPPSLRSYRLILDVNPLRILQVERATGRVCWQQAIILPNALPYLMQLGQFHLVQPPAHYRLRGHLAIISLGVAVVAIDLLDRRIVWWRDLIDTPAGNEPLWLSPGRLDGSLEAHAMFPARGSLSRLAGIGPLTSWSVPLLTRRGLEAVDPMTGTTLWSREDVPSLGDWLADGDFLYGSDEGRSFACRARDGRAGQPPIPFGTLLSQASPAGAASLFVSENEPGAEVIQRRYDVKIGKDLWLRRFPAGSLVLHSEDAAFAGTIDPAGNVTILDAVTGKELLHAAVNVRHLEKVSEASLFLDRQRFYIALSETEGPLVPGLGPQGQFYIVHRYLRPLAINGTLYAFDRATSRRCWFNALAHQMLLLDQIDDMPILLCVIGRQEPVGGGGGMTQVIAVTSIDKATGKFIALDKSAPNQGNPYHALVVKKRQGTIELVNANGSQLRHAINKP